MAPHKTCPRQAVISVPTDDGRHECLVCPIRCKLRLGQNGLCGARSCGTDGVRLTTPYLSSASIEPIEKRPIYHYRPNLKTLSIGGYGCNMGCDFCQNHMVSQESAPPGAKEMSPAEVVALAREKGCGAICFTYNEPVVYYEYLMDLAESLGPLDLVLKTNGYAEPEVWEGLCEAARAMNIDWKGSEGRYRSVAKVEGSTSRKRIEEALSSGVHVEISVPVYHDASLSEYEDFPRWIASLAPDTPVHLLKIFPAYRSIVPVTSNRLLIQVYEAMRERLPYVYIGNLYGEEFARYRRTVCAGCGQTIAERSGLRTDFRGCGCGTIKD